MSPSSYHADDQKLDQTMIEDGRGRNYTEYSADDKPNHDLVERREGSDTDVDFNFVGYERPPALGLKQLFSNGKL